jgi:SRSO17 transposase
MNKAKLKLKLVDSLLDLSRQLMTEVKREYAGEMAAAGWVPELTHEQFLRDVGKRKTTPYIPPKQPYSKRQEDEQERQEALKQRRLKHEASRKRHRLYVISTDDDSWSEQKTKIVTSASRGYVRQALKDSPVKTKVAWATSSFLLNRNATAVKKSLYWHFLKTYRSGRYREGWLDVGPEKIIDFIQKSKPCSHYSYW